MTTFRPESEGERVRPGEDVPAESAGTQPADSADPSSRADEVVDAEAAASTAVDEGAAESGDAVEGDIDDLIAQVRSERDQYLDLAQRTKADFDNFRKRMAAETASATLRGRLEVVAGIIEAIDNLERVLANEGVALDRALDGHFPEGAAVGLQGVIVAYRDLHATLHKNDVESFDPIGETFDPNLQEALQALPSEEVESGVVLEVMQRGYLCGDQVIRPARVVVSK